MIKLPFIERGRAGHMQFLHKKHNPYVTFFVFFFGVAILFFILAVRLFQLTIVRGNYYRRLAEENRIQEIYIEPERGTIIDRNGTVLAKNTPSNLKDTGPRLTSSRTYFGGDELGSIIGYRQSADMNDMQNDLCVNKLHLGDTVGKKGVEDMFECELRGVIGKKLIETDAYGRYIRTLSVAPPVSGNTVKLALDYDLQKKAYELLNNRKGAIIALNPNTGEILALASYPSFESRAFETHDAKKIQTYINDNNKPLFNRATEAVYPPGSIFKLVVATGALEEKKIDAKFEIEDTGFIKAGQASFGNWYYLQYGKTEGQVNLIKAIKRSNDIFFYKTGELLGAERIKNWAETFGFGKSTGSGLVENGGTLPSPFWKEEILKEKWYLGDTYNYSIGQGYTLVTPLQTARAVAVFANGGYLCTPQLLRDQKNCTRLPISQKTIELIREGMKEACAPGGTGWPFFDFKIKNNPMTVGCKTGTAESVGKNDKPHAWFSVFAPFDKPTIAVTVLLEEAGQGSDIGGPVAKELLTSYFK